MQYCELLGCLLKAVDTVLRHSRGPARAAGSSLVLPGIYIAAGSGFTVNNTRQLT